MKASIFIDSVRKLNPSVEELSGKTHEDLIEEYSQSFTIIATAELDDNTSLRSIVERCDTSKFSVFAFHFNEDLKPFKEFLVFGENESAQMAINYETGEVVDFSFEELEIAEWNDGEVEEMTTLAMVASNEEKFLDALYYAAELSSKVIKDEVSLDDQELLKSYAMRCGKLAGGNQYQQYWQNFVGYFG